MPTVHPQVQKARDLMPLIAAAARERIAMLSKIARGRHIPLTFSHHDRSTAGEGFTG